MFHTTQVKQALSLHMSDMKGERERRELWVTKVCLDLLTLTISLAWSSPASWSVVKL